MTLIIVFAEPSIVPLLSGQGMVGVSWTMKIHSLLYRQDANQDNKTRLFIPLVSTDLLRFYPWASSRARVRPWSTHVASWRPYDSCLNLELVPTVL